VFSFEVDESANQSKKQLHLFGLHWM